MTIIRIHLSHLFFTIKVNIMSTKMELRKYPITVPPSLLQAVDPLAEGSATRILQ